MSRRHYDDPRGFRSATPEDGKAPWYRGTTYFEIKPQQRASRDAKPLEDEHDALIEHIVDSAWETGQ